MHQLTPQRVENSQVFLTPMHVIRTRTLSLIHHQEAYLEQNLAVEGGVGVVAGGREEAKSDVLVDRFYC